MDFVLKYKPIYIIAPNDIELRDTDLDKIDYPLKALNLYSNKYISDKKLLKFQELIHLVRGDTYYTDERVICQLPNLVHVECYHVSWRYSIRYGIEKIHRARKSQS